MASLYPLIRSTAVTDGTTASATPSVLLPPTISAGDLLIVVFRSALVGTVTWPDGSWTELFNASPDGSDDMFAAAWKTAVGNEDGTSITLGSGDAKFAAYAVAISDAADPAVSPPQLSTVATGTTPTQPNPTAVTPTGGTKSYLFGTIVGMEGEATSPPTYPTGYALGQNAAASGTAGAVGTNVRVAGAWKTLSAASDDPGAWSYAGTLDDWSAYAIAVHPHPGAVGETLKVVDTVTGPAAPLSREVTAENVKLDDIGQGIVQLLGVLHITDEVTAAFAVTNLAALVDVEALKVADSVTTTLDPLQTSSQDALKVVDAPLPTLDPLGTLALEALRIADLVSVALNLAANAQDDLRLTDSADAVLDPLQAAPADVLLLTDADPTAARDLSAFVAVEQVVVTDAVAASLNDVLQAVLAEALRLADTEPVDDDEPLRLSDTVAAVIDFGYPLEAAPDDALRVADAVAARLDPLSASPSDGLKLSDGATPTLDPLEAEAPVPVAGGRSESDNFNRTHGETLGADWALQQATIHIFDNAAKGTSGGVYSSAYRTGAWANDQSSQVTFLDANYVGAAVRMSGTGGSTNWYAFLSHGNLQKMVAGSVTELATGITTFTAGDTIGLVIVGDTLTCYKNGVAVGAPVVDSALASGSPGIAFFANSGRLDDWIGLDVGAAAVEGEPVKITDTLTVVRQLAVEVSTEALKVVDVAPLRTLDPLQTTAQDALTVVDVVTSTLDPLEPAQGDALSIIDVLTADMEAAALVIEPCRVTDVLSVTLDPIETTAAEPLAVVDVIVATVNWAAAATDALAITDAVNVLLDPIEASVEDALRVADAAVADVAGNLNATVAAEVCKLADGPAVGTLDPLQATEQDALRIADATLPTLDPLEASRDEAIRLADILTAARDLTASTQDELRLADAVVGTLDPLQASVDEAVRVVDVADQTLDPLRASVVDALQIVDAVAVLLEAAAIVGEPLVLSDTVTALLDPIEASQLEALRVTDALAAAAAGNLTAIIADETLKLSDAPQAELDQLRADVAESILLSDGPPQVTLDPLIATAAELTLLTDALTAQADAVAASSDALRMTDAATAELDPLQTTVGDALRVADEDPAADIAVGLSRAVTETLKLADAVSAAFDLVVVLTEQAALSDTLYINGIPLTGLAFATETLSGDGFTTETLSGDIATDETLTGPVFTSEVLEP